MTPPNLQPYQTHCALALKYAHEGNFELAYLAMLEAASALLDDYSRHLQGQLTIFEELAEKPKPIDPAI